MAISNSNLNAIRKDENENTNISYLKNELIKNSNLCKINLSPYNRISAIIIDKYNNNE